MLAIALGFALLLLWAAAGKARDLAGFRAVLADYRIVPAPLLATATAVVPAAEAAIAALWLVAPCSAWLHSSIRPAMRSSAMRPS